jgi:hypothetical protein
MRLVYIASIMATEKSSVALCIIPALLHNYSLDAFISYRRPKARVPKKEVLWDLTWRRQAVKSIHLQFLYMEALSSVIVVS